MSEVLNNKEITDESVAEFLSEGSKILFIYAPNNIADEYQKKRLENIMESYDEQVSIGYLNAYENQRFPISYDVRSFPTTQYWKDGELISAEKGVQREIENSIMGIL